MTGGIRIVLGAVTLLVAAIALAPAAWLDQPLAARTQARVRLADAEGFWWRGRGALTSGDGAARVPLAWRVAVAPLLTGTLVVELESGRNSALSGTVTLTRETLDVRDLRLRAAAALIPALVPAARAFAWGGDVALHAPSFAWRNGRASGAFDASWERARLVSGNFAVDLGAVSIAGAPRDGALAAAVRNAGGDVAIDGAIGERAGAADATLSLTPTPSASDAVRRMLALLGPADGAGAVRVTWRSDR